MPTRQTTSGLYRHKDTGDTVYIFQSHPVSGAWGYVLPANDKIQRFEPEKLERRIGAKRLSRDNKAQRIADVDFKGLSLVPATKERGTIKTALTWFVLILVGWAAVTVLLMR